MPNYRRYYFPNSIIFITSVTRDRISYLESTADIDLLFHTLENAKSIYRFNLLTYVILPDHFHWVLKSESINKNFSDIIRSVKRNFTLNYKKFHNISTYLIIWQDRFWDHVIRDERDLENHIDYIHWNPVKHGFVSDPMDWPYSTYRLWLEKGYYPPIDTGKQQFPKNIITLDYE